jgi:hypothetical protein
VTILTEATLAQLGAAVALPVTIAAAGRQRGHPAAFLEDNRAVFGDLADDPRFTRVYRAILISLLDQGVRKTLADLGSATYLPEDYAESAGLLGRGAVRTADFVTATRPLDQVAEAFELASSGQHVKVLVTVGERRG